MTATGLRRCALVALSLFTLACQGDTSPARESLNAAEQQVQLRTSTLEAGTPVAIAITPNPYEGDAREIAEGRRLYNWMNCAGCHGPAGGGGIGPPLADRNWIYGGESMHIYQSILQGRPNGMPSYAGKVTEASVWRIAAFVRTLSEDAETGRDGSAQQGPPDQGTTQGVQP